MKRLPIKPLALAFLFTLMITIAAVSPVRAAPGLSIDGALCNPTLSPGQSYIHTMTVRSGADYPMEMTVEASGFGQSLDGSFVALSNQDDNSPYTALPFISGIDTTSFHLEPGGSQQVSATINVPAGVSPGTKYALIHIYSQPGGNTGIGVVLAANVLVTVYVPDVEPVKTGEITGLEVPGPESDKPVQVLTTFNNTGNIHFKVKNQVTITDETGNTAAQAEIPLTSTSVIPTFSRLMTATVFPAGATGLPAGRYIAVSTVTLENGSVLATARKEFDIVEASGKVASLTEEAGPVSAPAEFSARESLLGRPAGGVNWSLVGIIVTSVFVAGGIAAAYVMTKRRRPANGRGGPAGHSGNQGPAGL